MIQVCKGPNSLLKTRKCMTRPILKKKKSKEILNTTVNEEAISFNFILSNPTVTFCAQLLNHV